MEKQPKEFNELLQFISALVVRRIAQLGMRSEGENSSTKQEDQKNNIYKLAGSLTHEFKDEKFQQAKELAETSDEDKNLSPNKYALMWAETMPLGSNIDDVKQNFPETEGIAKKLLKIEVDAGKKLTIVAGISEGYTPKDIIGKQVIIVANLKSVQIMGILSNGMLLAALDDNTCAVGTVDKKIKPGTPLS